ncbi:hypothetical protein BSBH6_04022 [Bacillus subtilis]|nr:hypothetical protein BSBH6_04022 [Bacillus subtilis]RPK20231.1 hypothetical protein BH5_04023 [Bacillus subtilis]
MSVNMFQSVPAIQRTAPLFVFQMVNIGNFAGYDLDESMYHSA